MSGSEKLKKAAAAKLAYKESMEAMRGGKAEHDATLLKPNRQYAGVKVHNPASEGDVKRLVGENFYRIDFEHEGKKYILYASHNSGKKNKLAKRLFERTMMGKVLIIGAHQNVVKKWTYVKLDAQSSPSVLESSVASSSSSSSDPLTNLWAKLAQSEGSNLSQFLQTSEQSQRDEKVESVIAEASLSSPVEVVSTEVAATEVKSDTTIDTTIDTECLHHCDADTCRVPSESYQDAVAHGETTDDEGEDLHCHGESCRIDSESFWDVVAQGGSSDDEGEDLHLESDTSNILRDSA